MKDDGVVNDRVNNYLLRAKRILAESDGFYLGNLTVEASLHMWQVVVEVAKMIQAEDEIWEEELEHCREH